MKTEENKNVLTEVFGLYDGVSKHGWYMKGMTDKSVRKFVTMKNNEDELEVQSLISIEHLMDMKNYDQNTSNYKSMWTFECQDNIAAEL